jgi:hypothetical protein
LIRLRAGARPSPPAEEDILAAHLIHLEAVAERPAHADGRADRQVVQRGGHVAHLAHAQLEAAVAAAGRRSDGNRRLADAEQAHLDELSRLVAERLSFGQFDGEQLLQRGHLFDLNDPGRAGNINRTNGWYRHLIYLPAP